MASKKCGMGKGPNHIPKAPTNPDERILIQIRPPPNNTDFGDHSIAKCISQLCLQNWPTPAITWASTPPTHKDAVWAEFQESESQGTPIHWLDVYVATHDGLPDAVRIADTYRRLLAERYPEGTDRPHIDQELWEKASVVKKNYVKGQGQRRRPSFTGSGITQSSQSSSNSSSTHHTPADCVRAICQDRDLLLVLGGHLGAMDHEDLARGRRQQLHSSIMRDHISNIGRMSLADHYYWDVYLMYCMYFWIVTQTYVGFYLH